jgi:hypothetical protein
VLLENEALFGLFGYKIFDLINQYLFELCIYVDALTIQSILIKNAIYDRQKKTLK